MLSGSFTPAMSQWWFRIPTFNSGAALKIKRISKTTPNAWMCNPPSALMTHDKRKKKEKPCSCRDLFYESFHWAPTRFPQSTNSSRILSFYNPSLLGNRMTEMWKAPLSLEKLSLFCSENNLTPSVVAVWWLPIMPQENEKRGDLPHNPSNRTVMEEEEDSAVLLATSIFGDFPIWT